MTAARPVDLAVASGGILTMMLATMALSGGFELLSKPLWLDEYHTFLVATRESLPNSMRSLAMGADFNPPTLHLLYRGVDWLSGGLTPFSMRLVSLACMWLALSFSFATMRRHVSAPAAFGAVCAVWAHPLSVTYTFDARFYAPWLCFSALLVWATGVDRRVTDSRRRDVLLAGSAVAVCTIHYFGIFVWAIVAAVMVGARRESDSRQRWRAFAPMMTGPLALLACAPFYLGQRGALSTATWVPPVTASQLGAFLSDYFVWFGFLIPVALWLGARVVQQLRGADTVRSRITPRDRDFVLLLSLAAVPLVVVVFSLALQPSLVRRYAIPGLLCWVPLVAWILADVGRSARALVLAGHLGLSVALLRGQVLGARRASAEVAQDAAAIGAQMPSSMVVCRTRQRAYALSTYLDPQRPLMGDVCRFPVFDDTTALALASDDEPAVRLHTVERDVARVHARIYDVPPLASVEALRGRDHFFLLDESDTDTFGRLWFPAFTVQRIAPRLFRLQRVMHSSTTPLHAATVG